MSDKVIPIDPTKRITKEALDIVMEKLKHFDLDDGSFIMIYTDKEGGANCDAFGIDWTLLGISEAYLEDLRRTLLHDEFEE
jgi:hypothetical protein